MQIETYSFSSSQNPKSDQTAGNSTASMLLHVSSSPSPSVEERARGSSQVPSVNEAGGHEAPGSGCKRGGFLYEPANPPRKIVYRDASGPAANCLRPIAVHITKPAGQKKNPQEPAKSRVAPPLLSLRRSVFFPGAHARPPAALAPAVTHSIGRTSPDVSTLPGALLVGI